MNETPPADVVSRLATLEESVTRWKLGMAFLAVAAGGFCTLMALDARDTAASMRRHEVTVPRQVPSGPGPAASDKLDLADPPGKVAVHLLATIGGGSMVLAGGDAMIAGLANQDGPRLAFSSGHGSMELGIGPGGPYVAMYDPKLRERLVLGAGTFEDSKSGASVTTPPTLILFDSMGHVTFSAATRK